MSIFNSFNINASGMTAQRFRTDVISQNVANVNTTRTADGTPYVRKVVAFAERSSGPFSNALARAVRGYSGNGVKATRVAEDTETEMIMTYDPAHPDADENGYVTYPNVNIVTEMTNLIDASRSFEANVTAFGASKAMALKGLELGKK